MGSPRQNITLDLSTREHGRGRIVLSQGDHNGTRVVASITENGVPFDCDGLVPYLVMPDNRWEGTASGSTCVITVDERDLRDFHGTVDAYVTLESNDMVTSTQRFNVTVLRANAGVVEDDGIDDAGDDTTDKTGDGSGNEFVDGSGGSVIEEDEDLDGGDEQSP